MRILRALTGRVTPAATLLCLAVPALAGLALCAGGAVAAPAAVLAVGDTLPPLRGEFLTGRDAELPAAARGRVALLGLGFTYGSREAVEAWMGRFRRDVAGDTAVAWFEIPMIGGLGRLGKPFINRGMRRGTPEGLRENVVTVYGGTGPWKERLSFVDQEVGRDHAYLVLLDRAGVVRWIHAGPFEEAGYRELLGQVRLLRR